MGKSGKRKFDARRRAAFPITIKRSFIKTLRTGYAGAREINQFMPWWIFRNMSDEDLAAIFTYLKTLKPVTHLVDNSVSPTQVSAGRCNARRRKQEP